MLSGVTGWHVGLRIRKPPVVSSNLTAGCIYIRVTCRHFADKIGSACQPGAILLGERVLGYRSKIQPASRFSASKEFIKNSVVGLGLHQGMEYLLGRSIWETLGRSRLALSRLINSLKVLRHSKIYRYQIGHDPERNVQVLLHFLENLDL